MDVTETRAWRIAAHTASAESAEHRRLILAYPETRDRLCQPPLGYARPDQWTGYIPPRFDAPDREGVIKPNDSPRRTTLLELLETAAEHWDRDHRKADA